MRPDSLKSNGFTLLELVLGIALLGIVSVGALAMLINLAPRAVNPAMEVRAAQFAQRLLNDISLQKFDQNSGALICGASAAPACTSESGFGPDTGETQPLLFNDVDDYHTPAICAQGLAGCNDDWLPACWFTDKADCDTYVNFQVRILVLPADFGASCTDCAKRVDITLRQPAGEQWSFAVLRGNYQ